MVVWAEEVAYAITTGDIPESAVPPPTFTNVMSIWPTPHRTRDAPKEVPVTHRGLPCIRLPVRHRSG